MASFGACTQTAEQRARNNSTPAEKLTGPAGGRPPQTPRSIRACASSALVFRFLQNAIPAKAGRGRRTPALRHIGVARRVPLLRAQPSSGVVSGPGIAPCLRARLSVRGHRGGPLSDYCAAMRRRISRMCFTRRCCRARIPRTRRPAAVAPPRAAGHRRRRWARCGRRRSHRWGRRSKTCSKVRPCGPHGASLAVAVALGRRSACHRMPLVLRLDRAPTDASKYACLPSLPCCSVAPSCPTGPAAVALCWPPRHTNRS